MFETLYSNQPDQLRCPTSLGRGSAKELVGLDASKAGI